MEKATIYERVTIKGSDYDVELSIDFEAEFIPEELESGLGDDIEVTEVYDDYIVSLQNRDNGDVELTGNKNLLYLIGLDVNLLLNSHISENYEKYKNLLID